MPVRDRPVFKKSRPAVAVFVDGGFIKGNSLLSYSEMSCLLFITDFHLRKVIFPFYAPREKSIWHSVGTIYSFVFSLCYGNGCYADIKHNIKRTVLNMYM